MQIKTILRFYLSPVRIDSMKNTTTNKCWWGWGNHHTLLWECKLVQLLWKTIWRHLGKLNINLPYDPVIPLLGIYPKECDLCFYKSTCTPMFITELFTIAILWK
jgi:hypothetical protein